MITDKTHAIDPSIVAIAIKVDAVQLALHTRTMGVVTMSFPAATDRDAFFDQVVKANPTVAATTTPAATK